MKKEKLFDAVKKHWHLLAVYLFMSYVLTQVVVLGSGKIADAADSLFAGENIILGKLIPPFIVLTMIGTAAAFIVSYMKQTFSVNVQASIKNMAVRKLVKLKYSYYDTQGTGSIMNRLIADVYQVETLFSESVPEFLISVVFIATIGIFILFMDYKLFFVTVICYPLLLWLTNIISKKMGKLTGNRRELYDKMEETALDIFNGMIVCRTYNLNHVIFKRIHSVVDDILANEYIRTKISSLSGFIGNIITWIPRVVCYLFALYEVSTGAMTIGSLMAFAMLLDRIVHPFGEIPYLIIAVREQWVSFR